MKATFHATLRHAGLIVVGLPYRGQGRIGRKK
jgi:hypothetical protein